MSRSTHLRRRSNKFYYHRRVPLDLVLRFGKSQLCFSLGTSDPKLARKKRDLEDLKFNAVFDKLRAAPCLHEAGAKSLSPQAVIRMVQDYVEAADGRSKVRELEDPIRSDAETHEIRQDIERARSILKDDEDPNGRQWLYAEGTKLLGAPLDALDAQSSLVVHEILRRGLLELGKRRELRLDDDFSRPFLNPMFGHQEPSETTFGEMADQFFAIIAEEARANGTSAKWIHAQRANIALLKEIVGASTFIGEVDYDACMNVRSVLGAIPANRNKFYPNLELERAIQLADQQGRRKLSAVTQEGYLFTFRNILALAAKKRLITGNPAEGLKPITRETVRAKDRREPFTSEQLVGFFCGRYYRACVQACPERPYQADSEGWRFWMPLLGLFMGMRGNEICQLMVSDVGKTPAGTWFISISESEEDVGEGRYQKRVKDSLKAIKADARWKYFVLEHAERNAILSAGGADLRGATIYSSLFPCADCARAIVAAGISRIVTRSVPERLEGDKWQDHFRYSKLVLELASVTINYAD